MLQDPSAEIFSKQLLNIGSGKVTTHETGFIKIPTDFCTVIRSQNDLIDQVFPDIYRQCTNDEQRAERAILAAKNVNVN